MVQGAPQTAGRFDAEIRMYKAPPPEVSSEQFYETDPAQPYRRGFSIQTVVPAADHLGRARRRAGALGCGAARVHERLRALVLPGRAVRVPGAAGQPVTLAQEKDRYGLPVASFSYSQCDNDQQLLKGGAGTRWRRSCMTAGADEVITIKRYAHLVGGARMAGR